MANVVDCSPSYESDGAGQDTTMLSILRGHAELTPNNVFLVETAENELTYSQTWFLVSRLFPERLRSITTKFLAEDLKENARVLLISHNSVLFPLSLWSLWSLSATVIPVSISADPKLWSGIIEMISPSVILIARRLRPKLLESFSSKIEVIEIERVIPENFTSGSEPPRLSCYIPSLLKWLAFEVNSKVPDAPVTQVPLSAVSPSSSAVTLFTSSAIDVSTLKCVTYSHGILVRSGTRAMAMLDGENFSKAPKRHLGWLPLSHCFEFCISLCGIVLRTGGAYIFTDQVVSSKDLPASTPIASHLLSAVRYHYPVDSFCTVPAIFNSMVELSTPEDLNRLREMKSLGVGGAPISESLFQRAAEENIALFDCSGATEAAGTICIRRALVPSMRRNGLEVIPGLMGVLEKEKPEDTFGELIIRATFLPRNYDNRHSDAYSYDSSTGVTTYRTGDLYSHKEEIEVQYILKDEVVPEYDPTKVLCGLKYLGRTDDLVVFSSGVKIDALALERTLDTYPDILRSAILGDPSGVTLLAFIQPQPSLPREQYNGLVERALELNQSLPFEKRLHRGNVLIVDELPLTTKLTLNRKKLKKLVKDGMAPKCMLRTKIGQDDRDRQLRATSTLSQVPPKMMHTIENLLAEVFSVPVDFIRDANGSLDCLPLTSLSSVQLARGLNRQFSVDLTSAQMYSCLSIHDLCNAVLSNSARHKNDRIYTQPPLRADTSMDNEDLVITGAACRFPGSIDSLPTLWSALLAPESLSSSLLKAPPRSRLDTDEATVKGFPPMRWLEDDVFDDLISFREFFGLKPSDAEDMSPNARLALKLAYQAIEDSGISPKSLNGCSWGVFSCVNSSGWRERRIKTMSLIDYAKGLNGSADDAVGARLSYFLNLTGPAVELKTACSSSAVAIHQACAAIRNGDCDAAIVLSVVTHFHPAGPLFRSAAGIASPTGKCLTFSNDADGFLPSEGAAAIVIQKATDAKSDPYAQIRASVTMQDGRSHGFFSPNPTAQKVLIEKALSKAGCSPDEISYFEAHGTGTRLGDEIEISALNEVFGQARTKPLLVGSAKAVLGHLEEAAGLVGILKAILSFQKNVIPPQPYLLDLNDEIDFEASKIVVPREVTAFVDVSTPRLIGISSFGLSGTLAHIILQEPHKRSLSNSLASGGQNLYLLSGRSPEDFAAILRKHYLYSISSEAATTNFDLVCRTTQVGRDHHRHRRAWIISSWRALRADLHASILSNAIPSRVEARNPKVGLWFGLPITRQSLVASEHPIMTQYLQSLKGYSWGVGYDYYKQQLALALLLRSSGCNISIVGGEGLSEYVAAVFAGVLGGTSIFQEYVSPTSGRTVHSVQCSKELLNDVLLDWTSDELSIYGQHGPNTFSLIGSPEAIAELEKVGELELRNHYNILSASTMLSTPIHKPIIPVVSGHLGSIIDDNISQTFSYWQGVPERRIDSSAALSALAKEADLIVNIGGPDEIFSDAEFSRICLSVGNLPPLEIIGRLYELGCNLRWEKLNPLENTAHIPSYEWSPDAPAA